MSDEKQAHLDQLCDDWDLDDQSRESLAKLSGRRLAHLKAQLNTSFHASLYNPVKNCVTLSIKRRSESRRMTNEELDNFTAWINRQLSRMARTSIASVARVGGLLGNDNTARLSPVDEMLSELDMNRWIAAVKIFRDATDCGLKEAKDVIDMARAMPITINRREILEREYGRYMAASRQERATD